MWPFSSLPSVFLFCQQNLARLKDDSIRLITFLSLIRLAAYDSFVLMFYFTYVGLGSMWFVVDLCFC